MVMHADFVFGADIEIPFSAYPANTESREEWDLYWRCRSSMWRRSDRLSRCEPGWLDTFEERGYRSMLFVGNGISQEPQYFAYAGFQAVAMDLSEVVTTLASQTRWQAQALVDSFGIPPERQRTFLRQIHQFGGSATYKTGDLFEPSACAGPFDVIVIRRTLHLFEGPRLLEAIARLKQRLSPRGTLLIEVFQDQYARAAIERSLLHHQFDLRNAHNPTQWNADILFSANENRI